jgi:hypothetical protein
MRSNLVFGAMIPVSNRFLLAKLLAKATREFHRPGARIQDTTNEVLERFGCANPIAHNLAIRVSAIASFHLSTPQPAISVRPESLTVHAAHQDPQALADALWVLGA